MNIAPSLLAHAKRLSEGTTKRPRQCDLRRSISASYYALFHTLIHSAVRRLIGESKNRELIRFALSRAFNHGDMYKFCENVCKPTPSKCYQKLWTEYKISQNTNLRTVAAAFVELQDKRHEADYDLSAKVTKKTAADCYEQAAGAIKAWKRAKGNSGAYLLFLSGLLCGHMFRSD